MKEEYWSQVILNSVNANDKKGIDLLGKMIFESEQAKQILREKGYGWTGLSLLETVKTQVPESNDMQSLKKLDQ